MFRFYLMSSISIFFVLVQLSWSGNLTITTWNVRGYPETREEYRPWFSEQLNELDPDVVCLQEIANNERVNRFVEEEGFEKVAFRNTSDGQDNAIFAEEYIHLENISNPKGFKHLPQAAYVYFQEFDAVIITVHLTYTDVEQREREKEELKELVPEMLNVDKDVIICGDFNLAEYEIKQLADEIGLNVMIPPGQEGVDTTFGTHGNCYDHFLISNDLLNEEAIDSQIIVFNEEEIESAQIISDHRPVAAEFKYDDHFRDRESSIQMWSVLKK